MELVSNLVFTFSRKNSLPLTKGYRLMNKLRSNLNSNNQKITTILLIKS